MRIDTSNWKMYLFGDLIKPQNIYKGKPYTKEELDVCSSSHSYAIPYVTRTETNNSVDCFADSRNIEYFEKGNAIIVGDTTATASYQKDNFITGDHIVIIRAEWMNEYTGLFFSTLLNKERFRYSYGRAFLKDSILNTKMLLPTLGDKVNFEEIEKIIKSLNIKKITTKNNYKEVECLDVTDWQWFELDKLFDINAGVYHYPDEYYDGNTPYVSATNLNNGIGNMINLIPDFHGNKITTEKVKCCAFYQEKAFCATSDVNVLNPRFELNKYNALFIQTIINFNENYKWNYGRQCRVGDTKKIVIKLPVAKNLDGSVYIDKNKKFSSNGYVPDWHFMEQYIKSLPYSDKL